MALEDLTFCTEKFPRDLVELSTTDNGVWMTAMSSNERVTLGLTDDDARRIFNWLGAYLHGA